VITVKEAASVMQLSEQRIRLLCQQGRIAGALNLGRLWMLPNAPVIAPPRPQKPTGDAKVA
jgi:hypothetical protein